MFSRMAGVAPSESSPNSPRLRGFEPAPFGDDRGVWLVVGVVVVAGPLSGVIGDVGANAVQFVVVADDAVVEGALPDALHGIDDAVLVQNSGHSTFEILDDCQ
jgi:hypothetical protein